jgi:hypothetical protein
LREGAIIPETQAARNNHRDLQLLVKGSMRAMRGAAFVQGITRGVAARALLK